MHAQSLSRVWLFVTPWTAAYQAPLSTGFSRQECWSGVPLPSLAQWTVTFFVNECAVLACILKVVSVFIKEALEDKTLGANTNMEI